MSSQRCLEGVDKIARQVPPIGNLNGRRRPGIDAGLVSLGTIAGNDLYALLSFEPASQCLCLTVRE
jgi:hypothetical protein